MRDNFLISAMLENGAKMHAKRGVYTGISNAGKCGCKERAQLEHTCDRSKGKKPRPICDCCPGD